MKKILLSLALFGLFLGANCQENKSGTGKNIDKSALPLRSNSREYSPVRKTNTHQRMAMRQQRSMLRERIGVQKPDNVNRINSPNRPERPEFRRPPIMRRSQQEMMKRQQQRMLRRRMILQQQRKQRRR